MEAEVEMERKIRESKITVDTEMQTLKVKTPKLLERYCQTNHEEEESKNSILDDTNLRSMLSVYSNVSDQTKIKGMQDQMLKLNEQVVQLKRENKTLRKHNDGKGNSTYFLINLTLFNRKDS